MAYRSYGPGKQPCPRSDSRADRCFGLVSAILFYAQDTDLERHDYLFQPRKGGHINKQRADQIIKNAAHRAGLDRDVHAHLFRYGYAINFLNCGSRLDALQEQLATGILTLPESTSVYLTRP